MPGEESEERAERGGPPSPTVESMEKEDVVPPPSKRFSRGVLCGTLSSSLSPSPDDARKGLGLCKGKLERSVIKSSDPMQKGFHFLTHKQYLISETIQKDTCIYISISYIYTSINL